MDLGIKIELISKVQCGFRKGRSTMDHLIGLAFIKKEHAVAVFFDLEKAYDTTWKFGILKYLYQLGFTGHLPIFIAIFLSDILKSEQVISYLTHLNKNNLDFHKEASCQLLLLVSKSMALRKLLGQMSIEVCMLMTSGICHRGKCMKSVAQKIQPIINQMQAWSVSNAFKFSKTKMVCIHFCQLRSLHLDPEIFMDGEHIGVVKETKFLGITLDNKLSFIPRIQILKDECLKVRNI